MRKIRVVIGDDHQLFRDALIGMFQMEDDIDVVGQAPNGADLLRLARQVKPDVVIVDLCMPILNGIEVIARLRREALPCKSLCLTMHKDAPQVFAALDAGASGYVIKDNSYKELMRAIRCVMANQVFLSGELIGGVLHRVRNPSESGAAIDIPRLTSREREIAQLLSEGYSTKVIAGRLYVSAKTVATHREHIFEKLKIHSIAELTRYIIREGFDP